MQRQIKSIKQYAKVGKLDSSSHVEANAGEINIPTISIALAGSPNSCIIKIEHKKYRLVDSGAEVSLMHRRVYQSIKNAPKLTKKKALLQSVSGNSLSVDGCVNMTFSIGGTSTNHLFYVVSDMNRNIILGRDWLCQNGVRLYYDLGYLRFKKAYIPLVEDIHIASIVRMKKHTKDQTTIRCSMQRNYSLKSRFAK